MHKRVYISFLICSYEEFEYATLLFFYGFLHFMSMREIFGGERNFVYVDWARGRNLYFRNVTRCCCKIWNINASQHSHNRPRTNWAVRFILFLFQCVFIDAGTILWNGTCVVSIEILFLTFSLTPLLLSLPVSFFVRSYTKPKWVERTQPLLL